MKPSRLAAMWIVTRESVFVMMLPRRRVSLVVSKCALGKSDPEPSAEVVRCTANRYTIRVNVSQRTYPGRGIFEEGFGMTSRV